MDIWISGWMNRMMDGWLIDLWISGRMADCMAGRISEWIN